MDIFDTVRITVIVLEVILFVIIAIDLYNLLNLKLNNILKFIVYILFIVCTLFLEIDGFLIWYKG